MIVTNEPKDSKLKFIVLKLGDMHTEMSFLGSNGSFMAGSGIEDILEQVYAMNAVTHMLKGQHFLELLEATFW